MVARTAGIGASSPFATGLVKVGNPPMAAIPVEPEVRSRGGASSAARSKFAADSLLEGAGFELSVPREIGFVSRRRIEGADQ
jgi:hypothetical protein